MSGLRFSDMRRTPTVDTDFTEILEVDCTSVDVVAVTVSNLGEQPLNGFRVSGQVTNNGMFAVLAASGFSLNDTYTRGATGDPTALPAGEEVIVNLGTEFLAGLRIEAKVASGTTTIHVDVGGYRE